MNTTRENNTIIISGAKRTKILVRFIERQLEKWIFRETSAMNFQKEASYEVKLECEVNPPYWSCRVRVKIGSSSWENCESRKSLRDALLQTLRRMKPRVSSSPP